VTAGYAFANPPYVLHMTTVVIFGNVAMREIQLEDAKASLSAVIDEAMLGKPAVITRHGKRQAVIVSYEEWERLSHVPTFGRLLMTAPWTADDLPSRDTVTRPQAF
jgi:antitoxin Phd